MTQPIIDLDTANLDTMGSFLAERLIGLRRQINQRIPEHLGRPQDCACQPSCCKGFDRDWTPAEPHIETLLEAMCQAGYRYLTPPPSEQRRSGYYWHFGRPGTTDVYSGFDAISPLLAAYRAGVKAILAR
jgi:hypothetical protein